MFFPMFVFCQRKHQYYWHAQNRPVSCVSCGQRHDARTVSQVFDCVVILRKVSASRAPGTMVFACGCLGIHARRQKTKTGKYRPAARSIGKFLVFHHCGRLLADDMQPKRGGNTVIIARGVSHHTMSCLACRTMIPETPVLCVSLLQVGEDTINLCVPMCKTTIALKTLPWPPNSSSLFSA